MKVKLYYLLGFLAIFVIVLLNILVYMFFLRKKKITVVPKFKIVEVEDQLNKKEEEKINMEVLNSSIEIGKGILEKIKEEEKENGEISTNKRKCK